MVMFGGQLCKAQVHCMHGAWAAWRIYHNTINTVYCIYVMSGSGTLNDEIPNDEYIQLK